MTVNAQNRTFSAAIEIAEKVHLNSIIIRYNYAKCIINQIMTKVNKFRLFYILKLRIYTELLRCTFTS